MPFTVGQRVSAEWDPRKLGTVVAVDPWYSPGGRVGVIWDPIMRDEEPTPFSTGEAESQLRPMPPPIDARALLVKYMEHVGEQEGTDFVVDPRPERFTDAEWAELQRIAEEARR